MGVLHVLITYINFVNILKCQVLVALVYVDIHKSFSRNATEILFHQLVAPTILVLFLLLETEPHPAGKLS